MRIAIGGFLHESHSFAPRSTSYRDFVEPGGFPSLCYGAKLIDSLRDTSVPAAGAIKVMEAEGASIVPLAWLSPIRLDPFRMRRSSESRRLIVHYCRWLSMMAPSMEYISIYMGPRWLRVSLTRKANSYDAFALLSARNYR